MDLMQYAPRNYPVQEKTGFTGFLRSTALALGIAASIVGMTGIYSAATDRDMPLDYLILKLRLKMFHSETYKVPDNYHDGYSNLERLGVGEYRRRIIAAGWFTESDHRQFTADLVCKTGRAGDLGLTQITPVGTKEVPRRGRVYSRAKHLREEYAQALAIEKGLVSRYGKNSYQKLRKLLRHDNTANFNYGASLMMFYDAEAEVKCQKYGVGHTPELDYAFYNQGPAEMDKLLRLYGDGWFYHLGKDPESRIAAQRRIVNFTRYFRSNIVGF